MKKIIILLTALHCIATGVHAQKVTFNTSGSNLGSQNQTAMQYVNVSLSSIIDFSLGSSSELVILPFNTLNDYKVGVSSTAQELRVRTNKKFSLGVKTSASFFDYSGQTYPAPNMPVDSVLNVEINNNATSGNILYPFTNGNYVGLSNQNRNVLTNGDMGSNQHFSVVYKAAPGINYPVGTYKIDVIYTATMQ